MVHSVSPIRRHILTATTVGAAFFTACSDTASDDDGTDALLEAYEESIDGKADHVACSGWVVPDRADFKRRVALTFEDGPNPDTTPQILDVLRELNVSATFFITASRVKTADDRELIERIVAEGHGLEHRGFSGTNLKDIGASRLASEIGKADAVLTKLGVEPTYFRFPFGAASCADVKSVKSFDRIVTGWHVDSADWCFAKGKNDKCPASVFKGMADSYRSSMADYIVSQLEKTGGGIVRLNDGLAVTAKHLPTVISRIRDAGFGFTHIGAPQYFPLLNNATAPTSGPFIGESCESQDDECSYAFDKQAGSCHTFVPETSDIPVGICTLACEGTCPDREGSAPTFCATLDRISGLCLAQATEENGQCTKVFGTVVREVDRYVGESDAPAGRGTVCFPAE